MEFDWPTCGLSDAMKVFNIAHSGKAHRALNDAMDLARLYKKMKKTEAGQSQIPTHQGAGRAEED